VSRHSVVFFFFQAEDGIRDRNVTGVQTCALPLSSSAMPNGLSSSTSPAGSSDSSSPPPPVAQEDSVTPSGTAAAVYIAPRRIVRRFGAEMRESVIVLDAFLCVVPEGRSV